MAIPRYASILEIGCGPGLALDTIARSCKPSRLVGIDVEKDMLEEAQQSMDKQDVVVELHQRDVWLPLLE